MVALGEATVEAGLLDEAGRIARERTGAHRFAIITDERVAPLYADRMLASFHEMGAHPVAYTIPEGERHKNRETWAALTDQMLADGFGRDSAVVALGGGVVGDLAGFVAATYMRGLPVVQVPTTLLAMIDASIGGKTGVDTPAGKNLVGAFHAPAAVIVDPAVLATLPIEQLRSGLAEAIKHGVIADAGYFERVVEQLPILLGEGRADEALEARTALIVRSIGIKRDVVARDEREGGLRKILNFGHTIGHAVEHASGYELLHGCAVAVGMVIESRLAERLGFAEVGTGDRVRSAVERAGLPTSLPDGILPAIVLDGTRSDKKARGGVTEYALPAAVGRMAGGDRGWSIPVEDRDVLEAMR